MLGEVASALATETENVQVAPKGVKKKVRFSADTKDNETKSSTSVEITHADVIEVLSSILSAHLIDSL
jgi:hypothetical protein